MEIFNCTGGRGEHIIRQWGCVRWRHGRRRWPIRAVLREHRTGSGAGACVHRHGGSRSGRFGIHYVSDIPDYEINAVNTVQCKETPFQLRKTFCNMKNLCHGWIRFRLRRRAGEGNSDGWRFVPDPRLNAWYAYHRCTVRCIEQTMLQFNSTGVGLYKGVDRETKIYRDLCVYFVKIFVL